MFFFEQKTAYEMRISDWSSDVCSSDLEKLAAKQREEAVARDKIASELHPIKTPSPRYPIAAEQSGQEGLVLVESTVATNGTVSAAHVVTAQPAAVFDEAPLAAVQRWRFQTIPAPVTTQQPTSSSLAHRMQHSTLPYWSGPPLATTLATHHQTPH